MSNTITNEELKRLWAIASNNHWPKEDVKRIVALKKNVRIDLASTRLILRGNEYDSICEILSSNYFDVINSGLEDFLIMLDGQITENEMITAIDSDWRDPETGLNAQQYEAYCGLLNCYNDPAVDQMLLIGSAGTGKTYTIQKVIQTLQFMNPRIKILVTTPWHKALKVIRAYAVNAGIEKLEFRTLYSALSLRPEVNDDDGKHRIVKSNQENKELIYEYDLVIVDEIGVADIPLFTDLQSHLSSNSFRGKVIGMGDNLQLSPVGEKESKFFSLDVPMWELTQVMRFDGGIAMLVEQAKQCVREKRKFRLPIIDDPAITYCKSFGMKDQMVDVFQSVDYLRDTDFAKILCFTNKQVNFWNRFIRSVVLVSDDELFYPGETVITDKPIRDTNLNVTLANNGTELQILEVDCGKYDFSDEIGQDAQFTAYQLLLKDEEENTTFRGHYIVDPQYDRLIDERLNNAKQAKNKKLWGLYYRTIEASLPIKHNHALTVHKSQGSGFQNVFIISGDLNGCPDDEMQSRLWYVALSRAKNRLFIST